MSTTLPIKHNTIGINFVDLSDKLLVGVIDKLLVEGVIYCVDGVWWALVDEHLCPFFGFLLNRRKQCIVGTVLRECHNHGYSLLLCIVGLDVQTVYSIVALFVVWVGKILYI